MWRRQVLLAVSAAFLADASTDAACVGGTRRTDAGMMLIQQSLAPTVSAASKIVEQERNAPPSPTASKLISDLEVRTREVVQQPEDELSHSKKIAFVLMSAVLLVGAGLYVWKMINDYEAASSVSTPPWYTNAQILLKISSVMLLTWLSLGLAAFTQVILFNDPPRHLTVIESLYLSSQILTTVGYGDLTPSKPEGQVFVACYILMGVTLVAILIGELLDHAVNKTTAPVIHESQADGAHGSDENAGGEESGKRGEGSEKRSEGSEKRPSFVRTLHGESRPAGDIGDGIARRHTEPALAASIARMPSSGKLGKSKHQEHAKGALARAIASFLLAAVAGTLFFHLYPGEEKSIWLAFYMSCVTLTSVGFGATHPVTQGGCLFATFWMLFGVSCTANMICTLGDSLMKQRKELTSALMKDELLKEMDADGSGTVDKIEFLKFELVRKGICEKHDIDSVLDLFDELDTDGSGELDVEDFRSFADLGAL